MYSLWIVHNADSNSAQIEWHVDVPMPNCKLKLKIESPFVRCLNADGNLFFDWEW